MAKWSTGLPRGMSAPDPLRVAVSVPLGTTSARIYRVERLAGVDPYDGHADPGRSGSFSRTSSAISTPHAPTSLRSSRSPTGKR